MSNAKCETNNLRSINASDVDCFVEQYDTRIDELKTERYKRKEKAIEEIENADQHYGEGVTAASIGILEAIQTITLPDYVTDAMTAAIIKMQDYMRSQGKDEMEINVEQWNHFTYANKGWQFKVDQHDDGNWYVTSEVLYWSRDSISKFGQLGIDRRIEEFKKDLNLLKDLLERARDGTISKYLEE